MHIMGQINNKLNNNKFRMNFSFKCLKEKINLNNIAIGLFFLLGGFILRSFIIEFYTILSKSEVHNHRFSLFLENIYRFFIEYIFRLPLLNRYRHYTLAYYKHPYIVYPNKQLISLNVAIYLDNIRLKYLTTHCSYSLTNKNISFYDRLTIINIAINNKIASNFTPMQYIDDLSQRSIELALMQHINVLNKESLKLGVYYFKGGEPRNGRIPFNGLIQSNSLIPGSSLIQRNNCTPSNTLVNYNPSDNIYFSFHNNSDYTIQATGPNLYVNNNKIKLNDFGLGPKKSVFNVNHQNFYLSKNMIEIDGRYYKSG